MTGPKVEGIELLVPPDRQKHSQINRITGEVIHLPTAAAESANQPSDTSAEPTANTVATVAEAMRGKLRSATGHAIYKMRKAIVEPVFGQIKAQRGLRGFSFRGREKVAAEWQIICLTHNLLKMFRAGVCPQPVPAT